MLPSSNAHADVNSQITTVSAYSNGLVVGVSTGVAIIFEKTDDAYLYKKSKEFILEDTEVNSIAVNPTETMAIASLRNGQIYVLPVELDPSKGDVVRADRLIHSFHDGPILGMAVACHKPLIVTSGADKSIRVWNYLENTLEVCKYFPEVAQRYLFGQSSMMQI